MKENLKKNRKEMLNQVQHDNNRGCHPEFISGSLIATQVQNDCFQLGRSMIEILGVLAIVGVLSIGALTAYRMAMTSHRFNKLLAFQTNLRFAYEDLNIPSSVASGASNVDVVCSSISAAEECAKTSSTTYRLIPYLSSNTFWRTYRRDKTWTWHISNLPADYCERIVRRDYPKLSSFSIYSASTSTGAAILYSKDKAFGKLDDGQKKELLTQCQKADKHILYWETYN